MKQSGLQQITEEVKYVMPCPNISNYQQTTCDKQEAVSYSILPVHSHQNNQLAKLLKLLVREVVTA
jgi:hypothetical protein